MGSHASLTWDADTRPLLLGYVRAEEDMTSAELAAEKERLQAFARVEGYALGAVFTEFPGTAPAAFHALIEAVLQHEIRVIVVPNARHLGADPSLEDYLERRTGARVLVLEPS